MIDVESLRTAHKTLVGMLLTEAQAKIASWNCISRVCEQDGKHFMVTMDYRQDRVNLSVIDDKVTFVRVG